MPRSTSVAHRPAAIVAYAGAALFVVLLGVLHVVQPHLLDDATISKYALGRGGWMIQAAFVSAGVAYAGLARLLAGRSALLAWLTTVAFLVMGAFRIDAVGPNRVVSVHGGLHTGAFFVVVVVAHVLMFVVRRGAHSRGLRVLPFVAPVLAVVGFGLPGLAGALIFRAWTLCLVAWVVVTTREALSAHDSSNAVPATRVAV
jgi:hypothetical protein